MRTTINAKLVAHVVIELYASSKREEVSFLAQKQLNGCASLALMTDVHKYLGVRIYLIDTDWRFRSVLIGTRRFDPSFGERDY